MLCRTFCLPYQLMRLSARQVFNADKTAIWQLLMNAESLAAIIPGIKKLEVTSSNTFISLAEIKLGPVNSSFHGIVELDEIIEYSSFTLKARQESKIGNGNATIKIRLVTKNELQTEVDFSGDLMLTGLLAGMGQRIIGGVVNTLTKQFFSNLERQLENKPYPEEI
jgi:uncharacterized protein